MKDPLHHFFSSTGMDPDQSRRIAYGEKYLGVMLNNGQIGVCSTLGHPAVPEQINIDNPDLSSRSFRIFYNAYLNALLNYKITPEKELDIFQHIDFSSRKKVVMVGFFRSLVVKFQEAGIPVSIFDKVEQDNVLLPYKNMDQYLSAAGTVVLTSTTIFNGSFEHVIKSTSEKCDVFLLGPSSILHPDMKKYKNIKKVYGALFDPFDDRILDLIDEGYGTQTFLKFGRKVNI